MEQKAGGHEALNGNNLWLAMKAGEIDKVAAFIDTHGVNARFWFDFDQDSGGWVKDATVLTAGLFANNEKIAELALKRGAEPLVAEYCVEMADSYADAHPLVMSVARNLPDVTRGIVAHDPDLSQLLTSGSSTMYQSRETLAEAVHHVDQSGSFLRSIGLDDLASEIQAQAAPDLKTRTARPR